MIKVRLTTAESERIIFFPGALRPKQQKADMIVCTAQMLKVLSEAQSELLIFCDAKSWLDDA